MNGHREPLDAAERALAAALPRTHGRAEPDAALDARILAAAGAAAIAGVGRSSRPHRRSWLLPLGAAASVALAVGLSWRLRPLPPPMPPPAGTSRPAVQDHAAPAPASAALAAPAPPQDTAPSPLPHAPAAARATAAPSAALPPAQAAAPPPPPPPASAPAPPAATAQAAPIEEAAQRTQAPQAATAKTRSGEREAQDAITVTGSRVRNEAEMAADAAWPGDADEDVPPATADSPEVREAWLQRIGDLLREGRTQDARDSLAEFRRRYPDAPLPPELRALLP